MNSKKKSARNAGERHKSSIVSSADPTTISKCNQVHGKNIQQVNRKHCRKNNYKWKNQQK